MSINVFPWPLWGLWNCHTLKVAKQHEKKLSQSSKTCHYPHQSCSNYLHCRFTAWFTNLQGPVVRAPGIAAFPRATHIPQGNQNISILVAICPPEISVYSRYEFVFTAYNASVYTQNCLACNVPYSLLQYPIQHQF